MIDTCRGCGEWEALNPCKECAKGNLCDECREIHRQRVHTKGASADRLEHPTSYREKGFVEQWERENQNTDMVRCLLNKPRGIIGVIQTPYDGLPLEEISERDRVVAATIVQWLGSNVGWSFIEEALGRSGFQIIKTKESVTAP